MAAVKNVVFDVGNVLVKWDPISVVRKTFPEMDNPEDFLPLIFRHPFWYDLNLGKLSIKEAIEEYHKALNIEKDSLKKLFDNAKESLVLLEDTLVIVEELYRSQVSLYIITDNIHEFMAHLKQRYSFWNMFQGVVVSAEIGYLKPSPFIYRYLLENHQLNPQETVFFDDLQANVEGAKALDMHSFQFVGAAQCAEDLKKLGITLTT